jgi:hypothetical protein
VFNAFPYSEWGEEITAFWTFAGGDKIVWGQASLGTWIIVVLGFVLMIGSFIGFVKMENGKLDHQAAALRATGALDRPAQAAPSGS